MISFNTLDNRAVVKCGTGSSALGASESSCIYCMVHLLVSVSQYSTSFFRDCGLGVLIFLSGSHPDFD